MSAAGVARRPLVVGNWKMHKTVSEARALIAELRATALPPEVEVAVAPPFTALEAVHDELDGSTIELCAQNVHEAEMGAFTGEISPAMLKELGVRFVIVGHSERRRYFGETDASVARKVRAALSFGITPIVAVGESQSEHAAGRAVDFCTAQLRIAFEGVAPGEIAGCVVAYEPIWAIGTGLAEDPANANTVIAHLRACVEGLGPARFLYGGSMNPGNASALMAQTEIDGGLVGGASLVATSFAEIVAAARPVTAPR